MISAIQPSELNGLVIRNETCTLAAVRRVAAMLDQDPDLYAEGDLLPRGWQFILMGADTRRSVLRRDGFPGLGVPLPELGLPRLLLSTRNVRFEGDISIGSTLRRESRIEKLSRKETANGPMAIVTFSHMLSSEASAGPLLVETQTYLLLGAESVGRKVVEPPRALAAAITRRIVPDDTLLFQYSALCFNSHRIHWDRHYAREVEGYPDLVLNGGLATLLATEFLKTELGVNPTRLACRHTAPLFCDRPMTLTAEQTEGKWLLWAADESGRLALEIEAHV